MKSFTKALTLLSAVKAATGKVYPTRFTNTTWDDTNWRLYTTNLDPGHYQARMSLANGYMGINIAALGPFFEVDTPVMGDEISGWPLFDRRQTFATIAGFYDEQPRTDGSNFEWLLQYGGESVISGVPHWAGLHVQVGNEVLNSGTNPSEISNFSSTLDIKAGTLNWAYTWTPKSGSAINVEYQMFVHKLHVNVAAVQLKLSSTQDTHVSVIDVLNGDCATRTNYVGAEYERKVPVIWSAVRPNGLSNVTAYIYSHVATSAANRLHGRHQYKEQSVIGGNKSSIAQAVPMNLKAGQTETIWKYVGGASTDAFNDPQDTASSASRYANKTGYAALLASHTKEWRSIMTDDTVEDYSLPSTGALPADPHIIDQQIQAITIPFYLLQNTVSENAIVAADNNTRLDVNSISVGGLGSDSYAGFIFWDAEVWMAPGLVVTFPQAAKQIAQYRVEKFPQAQQNIKTAYQSSENKTGQFSSNGAVYPWTSSRNGNCTGTGPCFDYEYHINGDIGLELYNYYVATGDSEYFQKELNPIYQAIAQFYSDLVVYNEKDQKYELRNATDPDEYANFKNNVGYTMVLIHTHIDTANQLRERFGQSPNQRWSTITSKLDTPVNQHVGIIEEYQGMNGSIQVKQADVVLIDDFLDFPNPYTNNDFVYYSGKQSANGPGMTWGVFSIIANANLSSGCVSYTYALYGTTPYARAPWYQYSEQLVDNFALNAGTHPAFPFLTGMGGAHRIAVFGYLGLKLSLDTFNIDPSLPPQIPYLRYRLIHWQGWPIKAWSNQTHTTIQRLSPAISGANNTYATKPIPVTIGFEALSLPQGTRVYDLQPGGTLTFPNRRPALVDSIPGNIAQCKPVSSSDAFEIGQFPLSAVDGGVTTKWQPTSSHKSASMTVDLGEHFRPVSEIRFDWAQSPPVSYSVTFSNSSDGKNAVLVAKDDNVQVSNPYKKRLANVIVPYDSNTTNATLDKPVWSGRYATLTIKGNRALEGAGSGGTAQGVGATVAEFALVTKNLKA